MIKMYRNALTQEHIDNALKKIKDFPREITIGKPFSITSNNEYKIIIHEVNEHQRYISVSHDDCRGFSTHKNCVHITRLLLEIFDYKSIHINNPIIETEKRPNEPLTISEVWALSSKLPDVFSFADVLKLTGSNEVSSYAIKQLKINKDIMEREEGVYEKLI